MPVWRVLKCISRNLDQAHLQRAGAEVEQPATLLALPQNWLPKKYLITISGTAWDGISLIGVPGINFFFFNIYLYQKVKFTDRKRDRKKSSICCSHPSSQNGRSWVDLEPGARREVEHLGYESAPIWDLRCVRRGLLTTRPPCQVLGAISDAASSCSFLLIHGPGVWSLLPIGETQWILGYGLQPGPQLAVVDK